MSMKTRFFATATRASRSLTLLTAATMAVLVSAPLSAQDQPPQNWVPEVLTMPDDIEVLTDRAIGSSLRMFSFSTAQDATELLDNWQAELREAGYTIVAAEVETLADVIEFSGQGINNAKIAVTPSATEDRNVVQFDATLP